MEINIYKVTLKCDNEVYTPDKCHAVEVINICQQLKQRKPTTVQQISYKFS